MKQRDGSGTDAVPSGFALPVAIALAGALLLSFVDALRRRLQPPTVADASAQLPHDKARVGAFDRGAAGLPSAVDEGGVRGTVLRFAQRRRWRWLGRSLQVQQRYSELRGNELASSVTLRAFIAMFPLVLLGIAVLGFLQAGSDDFAARVIDALGLHGAAARQMSDALDTAANSRRATTILGLVGLLWAGLGLTDALRFACNSVWQVPDRGWRDRLAGLVALAGAAILFVAGTAAASTLAWLPGWAWPLGLLISWAVGLALFLWTTRVLANVDVGLRPLVPGALVGAAGLVVLQVLGAALVPRMVASASAVWGSLGVVFALLAWLLFFGKLFLYTLVLDVVLYEARAGTVVSVVEMPKHEGATRAATRSGMTRPGAPSAVESDIGFPVAVRNAQ
jgi:membrane protein